MANPYTPPSEATNGPPVFARDVCPICNRKVRVIQRTIPLLKCSECSTRLAPQLPHWFTGLWIATSVASTYILYQWLTTNPLWMLDYIWVVVLLPKAVIAASALVLLTLFGRQRATHWRGRMTVDEITRRQEIYANQKSDGERLH